MAARVTGSTPWPPRPNDAVVDILEWLGEDPEREGLADTPRRVLEALFEMTGGARQDPADVLTTTFDGEDYDGMVILRSVAFTSLCEHHLLPFAGHAAVGYIPHGRVVGISKLARLVDLYARRLQIQERMTTEIATAIVQHLDTQDVAVIVRAAHHCLGCRGVHKPEAVMVTSAMLGTFLDSASAARSEFLSLAEA